MRRGDPQVRLRLPGDLRACVKAQAQRNRRSMNSTLNSATDRGAEKFWSGLRDWHTGLAGTKGNAPGGESPEALDLQ